MRTKVIIIVITILLLLALWQKGEDMIELYVALIIAGKRTFDRVPARYQEEVRELLLALGLDENGNPIKEED